MFSAIEMFWDPFSQTHPEMIGQVLTGGAGSIGAFDFEEFS